LGIQLHPCSWLYIHPEPTLEFPGAALRPDTHTHRTCSRVSRCSCATEYMNILTRTYSRVSWCSSAAGYTYTRELTLRYPGELCCKQYIHTGTYSQVSWCSTASGYTYVPMYHNKLICTITFIMLVILVAIYFIIIITQEPTLRYPRTALLQALHPHRNLFTGLLVQLCCMLIHTHRDLLRLSWCISASG